MKIFNLNALESGTATVLVIHTFIPTLAELARHNYKSKLAEAGLETNQVAYLSLFDQKPSKIGVVELRGKMLELEELLKVSNINVLVDCTSSYDEKLKKYSSGLIFNKIFGKDVSLWNSRGVFVHKGGAGSFKWICSWRDNSIGRESSCKNIIDSEFVVQRLEDIEIREVTTLEGLKDLNNFLKDTTEVLFDIETNSLRYDSKDSKILCLQFGKRSEPYISYVVWYEKTGVDVTDEYKKYVRQLVEKIAYSKDLVAHNGSSFDIPWISYLFNLDPMKIKITDTLVLTYIARNSTRKQPMDLKTLVYEIMSDYDIELDTFKNDYCAEHKIKKEEFTYDYIPKGILLKYSAWDITALAYLLPQLEDECRNHIGGDLYEKVWLNFYKEYCSAIAKMSINGVPFDLKKAKEWKLKKEAELLELTDKLYSDPKILETEARLNEANYKKALEAYQKKCTDAEAKGKTFSGKKPNLEDGKYGSYSFDIKFNPASADHKRMLFFSVLGLKSTKDTATGATSVDSETALKLYKENPDIEVLGLFDGIAKYQKELTSFYEPYIELAENSKDGRVRGSYRINGTLSGRLSQTSPNLLQIPSKSDFKYLISTSEDSDYYIVGSDVTNLEGNIATMLSGDKALYEIKEYANGDAHSYLGISLRNKGIKKFMECKEDYLDNTNAEHIKLFKEKYPKLRHIAKTANFSCIFGIGGAGLASDLGITYDDGVQIVDGFWNTHSGLKEYFDSKANFAIENGYTYVEDLGLCLLTPDADADDKGLAGASARTSNNFNIQAYSFITHKANIWLNKKFAEEGLRAKVIVEIHDACYCEAHKDDLARVCVLTEMAMCMPFKDKQPYLLESPSELSKNMKGGFEVRGNSVEEKMQKVEDWLKEN